MGKGKRYEMELVNGLCERDGVWAGRPDYSGNSKHAVADIVALVDDDGDTTGAFIEVKKRQAESGKRTTVCSGSADEQSGLEELRELIAGTPDWAAAYFAVKFDHRELVVIPAKWLCAALRADKHYSSPNKAYDTSNVMNFHSARLTPAENVSMVKPTLDEWESSTSGVSDVQKIANEIR